MIKVGSEVTRPVCPRCSTAHTFIKCGKASCATLMCLPENVNQFSCPRCGVQLARPGFKATPGPIMVRCGNPACSFLLSVAKTEGGARFQCPKCSVEQLLPEDPVKSLKSRMEQEESKRQAEAKMRQADTLQQLSETFTRLGIENSVIECVYEECANDRFLTRSAVSA